METFSERNRRRCESRHGFNHTLSSWSLSDWMTAVAGEVGEAANIIKKLNRFRDGIPGNRETEEELRSALADEIADAAIYLDLLAQAAGFDLETIRDAKFDKTSDKIGFGSSTLTSARVGEIKSQYVNSDHPMVIELIDDWRRLRNDNDRLRRNMLQAPDAR